MSGIPFKKGRKTRRDFVGSGVDTRRLARRMIAEFAVHLRGVQGRVRPGPGKKAVASRANSYIHPADVAWGSQDHFHYIPGIHWTIKVGAFGGWVFLFLVGWYIAGIHGC